VVVIAAQGCGPSSDHAPLVDNPDAAPEERHGFAVGDRLTGTIVSHAQHKPPERHDGGEAGDPGGGGESKGDASALTSTDRGHKPRGREPGSYLRARDELFGANTATCCAAAPVCASGSRDAHTWHVTASRCVVAERRCDERRS
jgi:hypothetical protein